MKQMLICVVAMLFINCFPAKSQPFEKFLQRIKIAPDDKILREFLAVQPAIPIIEGDTLVYFLYYGNASSAAVAGDATAWKPTLVMKNIPGTKLWYASASYEKDARLEYKIVVNGDDWRLDSLNKRVIVGGMGPNSELLMPGYQSPQYIYERDVVPWGTYSDTVLKSKFLGENRQIRIYLPPNYERTNERYPVIFFHDGFQFFDFMAARNIMDNMTFEKRIRPLIGVFVEPVHRDAEYSGKLQDKYSQFIMGELIPYMDANYRTIPDASARTQAGISNGGNIALWLAISHPEAFSRAAAFSSNVENNIINNIEKKGCNGYRFYVNLGKYDLPELLVKVRKLKTKLEAGGCKFKYREYPEGHNWAFWQKYLPEALEYLFPID